MSMQWYREGEPIATVSVHDRGFQYGDGLFETIAWRGGAARFFADHLERLGDGCERLRIQAPEPAVVHANLLAAATHPHGTVKLIVTRGEGPRGYAPPANMEPLLLVGFEATEPTRTPPMRVRICTTRLSRNRQFAGCKTLNRLEQVMARAEWDAASSGIAEGLMLNDLDQVICGTMSNLFLVTGSGLTTPVLDSAGVRGVMRRQVLKIAAAGGMAVKEDVVTLDDVRAADGVFVTNALIGLAPVAELDDSPCASSDVIEHLSAALAARGVQECAA